MVNLFYGGLMNKYLDMTFEQSLDIKGTLILIRNTRKDLHYSPWDLTDYHLIKMALSDYFVDLIDEKRVAADQVKPEF